MMFGFTEAYVIQYPTGKFGFVGKVPVALAYEYESEEDLRTAKICGPGFARKAAERNGRVFRTRVWDTEAAALAALAALEGT